MSATDTAFPVTGAWPEAGAKRSLRWVVCHRLPGGGFLHRTTHLSTRDHTRDEAIAWAQENPPVL